MVTGKYGIGAPSKLPWMLSPGVSSSSAVVFVPMLIKLVKWFPSTTNAYFICQEGERDNEERTYPISDKRSQVPPHVETCEFSYRNLDEYLCTIIYVPSWTALMI